MHIVTYDKTIVNNWSDQSLGHYALGGPEGAASEFEIDRGKPAPPPACSSSRRVAASDEPLRSRQWVGACGTLSGGTLRRCGPATADVGVLL